MCQSNSAGPACGVVFCGAWRHLGQSRDPSRHPPYCKWGGYGEQKQRSWLFAEISACFYLDTRRIFFKKTLSFLYNGGFVLGLGRKVSPAVTAEGVTSEAEATWCDSPQPLNFKIPFNLRTLLWISLSFKSSLLLPSLIFGLAVSKNKDW